MRCGLPTLCMLIAVTSLVSSPALAQNVWSFEARSLAMGNAVVAVADDSAAWLQNPAGLPYLMTCETSRSPWPSRLSATTDLGLEVDTIGVNFSARERAGRQGVGGGYWHLGDYELNPALSLSIERFGSGYGARVGENLSVGVAVAELDMQWDFAQMIYPQQSPEAIAIYSGKETIIDLGLMYRRVGAWGEAKAGAVVRDVADNMKTTLDIGVAYRTAGGLLVTAEMRDATDEVDGMVNLGAEYRPPQAPELTLLAGLADGDTTYGAGHDFMPWSVSVSRQHLDFATETAITLCASF